MTEKTLSEKLDEAAAERIETSSQAKFSTYKKGDPDAEERNPPDGLHVVQERGKPS